MSEFEGKPTAARNPQEGVKNYTPEQILKAMEEEGVTVLKAPQEYHPVTLNYDGLESEYPNRSQMIAERAKEAADACGKFLAGGLFTDSFANHSQRRQWRHEMYEKYGDAFANLYAHNQLRLNSIVPVHLAFIMAFAKSLDVYKVHSPKADAIRSIAADFPDMAQYDDENSAEDKLAYVRKVEDVCKQFLEIMAAK